MKQKQNLPQIQTNNQQLKQSCPYKFCTQICNCLNFQQSYILPDPSQLLFQGILVYNPNNPGLNISKGYLDYTGIDKIPILNLNKLRLNLQNDYMFIHTLQMFLGDRNQPILLGLDQRQARLWFCKCIQAKLVITFKIKVQSKYLSQDGKIEGSLFKKSMFGQWKRGQATLSLDDGFRWCDQLVSLGKTSKIWTRFELINEGILCLVLKIQGTWGKKQYGIPLTRLTEWISAFGLLLKR